MKKQRGFGLKDNIKEQLIKQALERRIRQADRKDRKAADGAEMLHAVPPRSQASPT